ncbi:MAG: hypothetical protein R2880_21730 [Deinococcales bacterium]
MDKTNNKTTKAPKPFRERLKNHLYQLSLKLDNSKMRLHNTIEAYELEVEHFVKTPLKEKGHQPKKSADESVLNKIDDLIETAKEALLVGNAEKGWQCLHTAQRLEVMEWRRYDGHALEIKARSVFYEIEQKLVGWRKKAALERLNQAFNELSRTSYRQIKEYLDEAEKIIQTERQEEGEVRELLIKALSFIQTAQEPQISDSINKAMVQLNGENETKAIEHIHKANEKLSSLIDKIDGKSLEQAALNIYEAMTIMHEHYSNDHQKRRALKAQLTILAWAASIAGLLWIVLVLNDFFEWYMLPNSSNELILSVVLFGVMGASFSGILSIFEKPIRNTIGIELPDILFNVLLSSIRLIVGALSAIVAYVFLKSGILKIIATNELDGGIIVGIAFIAGFSERLVVNLVRNFVFENAKAIEESNAKTATFPESTANNSD